MRAIKRIKLRYPSVGSFCEEYRKNLQYGGIYVPSKNPPALNEIVELVLTVPDIEEPFTMKGRVVQVNNEEQAKDTGQKPGMALQIPEEENHVLEKLKSELGALESYRKILGIPPPAGKPAKKPPPPPDTKPEDKKDDIFTTITLSDSEEEDSADSMRIEPAYTDAEESHPEVRIKRVAPRKKAEEVEEVIATKISAPAEPAPSETPEVSIKRDKFREDIPTAPERVSKPDMAAPVHEDERLSGQDIDELRSMVGDGDVSARPARKEIKVKEPVQAEKRQRLTDQERNRLAPVARLAMSLVKAMLRSGYYSPDHPGAQDAKKGLFSEFREALGENPEISFISRITREASDILIGGILDEPVSLRAAIPGTQAEMFIPKYREYFERKKLMNFTIKKDISEQQFDDFIDIMSDPSVDKGDGSEAGQLLTDSLVKKGITSISTVFEDDLIMLEVKLPWRVEMAINRLAKDLKVLPMYQDVSAEQIQQYKKQIVQDIIRPLREPHMLKDIVVNAHLIAQKVKEIDAEDLEQTIISCFPMQILIPTSEFIFTEMEHRKEDMEKHPESEVLNRRIEGIKRILKWISLRVVNENVEEGLDFLEQLYFHEILSFEELPPPVQDRVNTIRLATQFCENPSYYITKFKEARVHEDYLLFLRLFKRILPELLDSNSYENIYLLTQALSEAGNREPETLEKLRGEPGSDDAVVDEMLFVWDQSLNVLKQKFMAEKKETREGIDMILELLGENGMELLINILEESQDRWVRKSAIDELIKSGEKARNYVRAILESPARQWALHRNALFIIGQIGNLEDSKVAARFLRHSDARLREEALGTISRLEKAAAEPKIINALDDPDARVRRRAVACLGLFRQTSPETIKKLVELVDEPDKKPDDEKDKAAQESVRLQAIHTLGIVGNHPLEEGRDVEDVMIDVITSGSGWAKKLIRRVKGTEEQSEKMQLAAAEALGKMGTAKSLEALKSLEASKSGQVAFRIKDAIRQIEIRQAGVQKAGPPPVAAVKARPEEATKASAKTAVESPKQPEPPKKDISHSPEKEKPAAAAEAPVRATREAAAESTQPETGDVVELTDEADDLPVKLEDEVTD